MSHLHDGQKGILRRARRFSVVPCGRRFGKTTMGLALAFYGAPGAPGGLAQGYDVGWFAPTYKILDEAWRAAKKVLRNGISRIDSQQHRLELKNGSALDFWTLEKPDGGRGRRYGLAIIDEAAMARNLESAWNEAIRATLTDYRGGGWFFSTPKGRNYFWHLAQRGENLAMWPDWATHPAPTVANPFIDPAEVEAARRSLPERIFRQEYLAEFLDDSGGVFRGVQSCVDDSIRLIESPSSSIVIGIDWGRHNDFTVIVALDAATGHVVAVDRFTDIDYGIQFARLRALHERFPRASIIAESNAMGGPLVEALQRQGLPVTAFETTAPSKRAIIEALALAFERGDIALLDEPWLIDELLAYEQERLPGGLLRYSAPPGGHDDGVMALALAWHGAHERADIGGIKTAGRLTASLWGGFAPDSAAALTAGW